MGASTSKEKNDVEKDVAIAYRPYVVKQKEEAVENFNNYWDVSLKEACKEFFKTLDVDGNNCVSYEELVEWAKIQCNGVPLRTLRKAYNYVDGAGATVVLRTNGQLMFVIFLNCALIVSCSGWEWNPGL